jgi:hypothetical protein
MRFWSFALLCLLVASALSVLIDDHVHGTLGGLLNGVPIVIFAVTFSPAFSKRWARWRRR